MKTPLLLLAIVGCHYGYYFAPAEQQAVWFYALHGVEGAILCWALATSLPKGQALAISLCWLGFFQESQIAVCGFADVIPSGRFGDGMCMSWIGPWLYRSLSICIVIAAFLYIRAKNGRKI